MSIEQSLERIAVAMESIAASKAAAKPLPADITPEKLDMAVKPEPAGKVAPVAEKPKTERQRIIDELTAMGEAVGRQRTEYLKKKLAKLKAEANAPAPVAEPEVVEPEVVEPTAKMYNIDDARETLKKFAATQGLPKATALLVKYKAKKVSDLEGENLQNCVREMLGEPVNQVSTAGTDLLA